jgi:hypothetical protein
LESCWLQERVYRETLFARFHSPLAPDRFESTPVEVVPCAIVREPSGLALVRAINT